MNKLEIIFDFGGVICDNANLPGVMGIEIPELPGAFDAIRMAVSKVGHHHVHILSKCSIDAETFIRHWLIDKRIARTGFFNPRDNVHFCRNRKDKAYFANGINESFEFIMIDNRWDVLQHFINPRAIPFLINPSQDENLEWEKAKAENNEIALRTHYASSWEDGNPLLEMIINNRLEQ